MTSSPTPTPITTVAQLIQLLRDEGAIKPQTDRRKPEPKK